MRQTMKVTALASANAAFPAAGLDAADAGANLTAENSRHPETDGDTPIDYGWLTTVPSAKGEPEGSLDAQRNYRRVSTI